jgi:hypothetical protein
LQITFELRDLAETYGFLDRVRRIEASLVRLSIKESPSSVKHHEHPARVLRESLAETWPILAASIVPAVT